MKTNYEFIVNAERNGFEVHFKAYNKAAWDCLIKNYKMLPMAKKSFVYATPKKLSVEEFWVAFEKIAKGLEFTDDEYKLYVPQILEAERNAYGVTFHSAKFDKYLKTEKPAKQASKSRKSTKTTKSKATAKAVALPKVAEDLYDIFR